MELDAAIMDGKTCAFGAVVGLKKYTNAIKVARLVMEKSEHNMIVGDGAFKFALSQGLHELDPLTEESKLEWDKWKKEQNNADALSNLKQNFKRKENKSEFRKSKPSFNYGINEYDNYNYDIIKEDYQNTKEEKEEFSSKYHNKKKNRDPDEHDTIGLICRDSEGNLAVGTSTSGWKFKHPGRAGDSAIIGSGFYCDNTAGAAVASGDGEDILRSCLSFLVVEYMRNGFSPQDACTMGIKRLESIVYGEDANDDTKNYIEEDIEDDCETRSKKHTSNPRVAMHEKLTVAVIAMNKDGEVGAGTTLCEENPHRGRPGFPYPVWKGTTSSKPSSSSSASVPRKGKGKGKDTQQNNNQIIEYEVSRVD